VETERKLKRIVQSSIQGQNGSENEKIKEYENSTDSERWIQVESEPVSVNRFRE
jgi:hypothetical protein